MMHFKRLVTLLSIGAAALVWQTVVKSQGPGSAAASECKNKQAVQFHSSGSFFGPDTSQVKCVVDYWICGNAYQKSKIVKNASGACDSFRDSVIASVPSTVCCDCYPNCGSSGNTGSNDQPQKQDCCSDIQQLKAEVEQLRAQVRELQNKLNGSDITLGSGGGKISITNNGVSISSSGAISIKAAGAVTIKGARVTTN